jgi:hypothetical protein
MLFFLWQGQVILDSSIKRPTFFVFVFKKVISEGSQYTAGGYMYEVDFVLFGEYLMRLAKLLNPYQIKDSVYIQLHRQGEILDQLLG